MIWESSSHPVPFQGEDIPECSTRAFYSTWFDGHALSPTSDESLIYSISQTGEQWLQTGGSERRAKTKLHLGNKHWSRKTSNFPPPELYVCCALGWSEQLTRWHYVVMGRLTLLADPLDVETVTLLGMKNAKSLECLSKRQVWNCSVRFRTWAETSFHTGGLLICSSVTLVIVSRIQILAKTEANSMSDRLLLNIVVAHRVPEESE